MLHNRFVLRFYSYFLHSFCTNPHKKPYYNCVVCNYAKFFTFATAFNGVWRSWLAYLHGVQVVVRSSRITPTQKSRLLNNNRLFYCCYLSTYAFRFNSSTYWSIRFNSFGILMRCGHLGMQSPHDMQWSA